MQKHADNIADPHTPKRKVLMAAMLGDKRWPSIDREEEESFGSAIQV